MDQVSPVDVQYARVNKKPRAVSENTPNFRAHPDLQGATVAFSPPSIPNFDTTAADWKLEHMHTYEETPHAPSHPEEIDCYAMGWRRQAVGDEGENRGKQASKLAQDLLVLNISCLGVQI